MLSYKKYAGRRIFQTPLEGARLVLDFLQLLHSSDTQNTMTSNEGLVREVKNKSINAFDESLTTSSLAKNAGISREHLSRTFHTETGQTLRDYRADQRMNEAVTMLLKTSLSCKEIAHLAHFGSYSSFYRAFISKFKTPPESFRRKQ
ncbi:MAG: helix-turn-helix transcriptional regulator [Victivallales bacterium]|nr:helix-turn-helix transcriptional regulator [Victivallales bacterium]